MELLILYVIKLERVQVEYYDEPDVGIFNGF
mgnify:FL=1